MNGVKFTLTASLDTQPYRIHYRIVDTVPYRTARVKETMVSAVLYRLGRACFRHHWRVIGAWLMLAAIIGTLLLTAGGDYDDTFTVPGASSTEAWNAMAATFPQAAQSSAMIVVGAPPGHTMTDQTVKKAIDSYLDELDQVPFVIAANTPYSDVLKGYINADSTYALIRVNVQGTTSQFTDAQRDELRTAAMKLTTDLPGSTVDVGGDVYSVRMPSLGPVEAMGLVVAVVVLAVTLGGLLAAIMPIGSAVTGVALAYGLSRIGAGMITVMTTTMMLIVMLSLAVGIDYALFIISRHRDQLRSGMDVEESAARAVATAGSAVCFAGMTVIIALVGLSIANLPFLTIMGLFTAVGVFLEVMLALTLLPAFMGLAREHLRPKKARTANPGTVPLAATPNATNPANEARGTVPMPAPERGDGSSGPVPPNDHVWRSSQTNRSRRRTFSRRWVSAVTRWPVLTIVLVIVGMGSLAIPAQHLDMALPNSGHSIPGTSDRAAFDLISKEFGIGFNGPLVVTGTIAESDDPMGVVNGLHDQIETMPGVKMVATATPNANADTAMIQIIPTTGPDDPATADLVNRLRAQHDFWQSRYGIDTAVTGLTAVEIDVTDRLGAALLPFGIFVVGLSFVLLAIAFRSLWVPLKAALGYLLSIGAAFGLTTLVFNEGVGEWLINLPEPVPVVSFLPIILMGILFGLSMDYEVFLTSRMREEYIHGDADWVRDGFVHSAKVVTAAALIMFSVFAFFVPMGAEVIKPIAFALAVGIFFDAFLVRMTLGPAVMTLMGRHAWWLPGWLERRLPVIDVEGESLAHQMALADWPAPGDTSAVYAEGLRAEANGRVLLDGLDLVLAPGDVLVVRGDRPVRLALAYGLSGRVPFTGGRAKVLGRVLPEEAALVRLHAPIVAPDTRDLAAALKPAAGGLAFVPETDQLAPAQLALLHDALTDPEPGRPVTWVLGVAPGTDVAAVVPGSPLILELSSPVAMGV